MNMSDDVEQIREEHKKLGKPETTKGKAKLVNIYWDAVNGMEREDIAKKYNMTTNEVFLKVRNQAVKRGLANPLKRQRRRSDISKVNRNEVIKFYRKNGTLLHKIAEMYGSTKQNIDKITKEVDMTPINQEIQMEKDIFNNAIQDAIKQMKNRIKARKDKFNKERNEMIKQDKANGMTIKELEYKYGVASTSINRYTNDAYACRQKKIYTKDMLERM